MYSDTELNSLFHTFAEFRPISDLPRYKPIYYCLAASAQFSPNVPFEVPLSHYWGGGRGVPRSHPTRVISFSFKWTVVDSSVSSNGRCVGRTLVLSYRVPRFRLSGEWGLRNICSPVQ